MGHVIPNYSDDVRLKFLSVPATAGKYRFFSNPNLQQSATALLNYNAISIVYNIRLYENIAAISFRRTIGRPGLRDVKRARTVYGVGPTRRQRGAQRASSAPGGRSLHHTHTQYNNILIYVPV